MKPAQAEHVLNQLHRSVEAQDEKIVEISVQLKVAQGLVTELNRQMAELMKWKKAVNWQLSLTSKKFKEKNDDTP
jgi:hypothetical protein